MIQIFSDFSGLEMFFVACAAVGGLFVLVKLVLQCIGSDADTDVGVHGDIGIDTDHADSDVGFRVLSLQGLSAFFMMFGLVGLASYRQSRVGVAIAVIVAVAAGLASVWFIGRLFRMASRLQSSGTLQTRDAVGCTGTVYLTIPEKGSGRVSLNFRNHLREFDAIELNGAEVPTGTPVRVLQVNGNVLVVVRESNL